MLDEAELLIGRKWTGLERDLQDYMRALRKRQEAAEWAEWRQAMGIPPEME